jgi:hypothetical protein
VFSPAILRSDGLRVSRMRVRCADPDGLRVRQRIEAQLVGIGSASIGLPPKALLFVKRLAATTDVPLPSLPRGRAMSLAVCRELSRSMRVARRPWLDAGALRADAVLFADEAELVACLVRDWLRGVVADRWWWQSVLGSAGVERWLREHVLPRGDALVPALSLLAPGHEVVPYMARLGECDVRAAVTAVTRAFALPMPVTGPAVDAGPIAEGDDENVVAPAGPNAVGCRAKAAVERLAATVPEMRLPALDREQRRLLVLVLAVARALSWARTEEFSMAMLALDRYGFDVDAVVRSSPGAPRTERPARRVTTGAPVGPTESAPVGRLMLPDIPVTDVAPTIAGVSPGTPRPVSPTEAASPSRSDDTQGSPAREGQPVSERRRAGVPVVSRPETRADAPAETVLEQATRTDTDWWTPLAETEAALSPTPTTRVETQYGGIFYLLNAWLAMELYADFTAPRGQNLALSPWDLLALVGRAWFRAAFVDDPIWKLLADLAARDPEDEPSHDVDLPDGWLEAHLDTLSARLQSALGCGQTSEVPAIVCRHHAVIETAASSVHVHLSLSELPLDIRIAGLDRDPGWIPAAGRAVYFCFGQPPAFGRLTAHADPRLSIEKRA